MTNWKDRCRSTQPVLPTWQHSSKGKGWLKADAFNGAKSLFRNVAIRKISTSCKICPNYKWKPKIGNPGLNTVMKAKNYEWYGSLISKIWNFLLT